MTLLLLVLITILILLVLARAADLVEKVRALKGDEEWSFRVNTIQGTLLVLFMVGLLGLVFYGNFYYRDYMLGFGPHESASEHGLELDKILWITIVITGIVFVLTQVALFYFAFKYRRRKGSKAEYISHDNKLELIWTITPAVVMTLLVFRGLDAWNSIMPDVKDPKELVQLEVTGFQFGWIVRYPGPDNELGPRDYRKITGSNPLGQLWDDARNRDDILADKIVLPKGKKVRVTIRARDVLHSFFLPHFRVKMDAVPGMPTYAIFTPRLTTEEYRQKLSKIKEYQVPADPEEPDGPKLWETFHYELACAELCGVGHFGMRREVVVVEPEEYEKWLKTQKSYYLTNIKKEAPAPDDVSANLKKMLETGTGAIRLDHVKFQTGSAKLTEDSMKEIAQVAEVLKNKKDLKIEVAGHTDNQGNEQANLKLSQQRAEVVADFLKKAGAHGVTLIAKGYGASQPVASNDTPEGRAQNRRTELRVIH